MADCSIGAEVEKGTQLFMLTIFIHVKVTNNSPNLPEQVW